MKYYNGFQHLTIDSHVATDLSLYDKDLVIWQNDEDQYFYISYNPNRKYQCSYEQEETARKRVALKVMNEDGERCLPSEKDIYILMARDGKFTTAKQMIKVFNQGKIDKEKQVARTERKNLHSHLIEHLRKNS